MRMDSSASFGALLKRFRLAMGLSQEELAERAGLSPRGVSDLERGARTQPRPGTVRLLADALNLASADRTAFFAAAAQRTSTLPETRTASDATAEGTSESAELPHLSLPVGSFLGALPDGPLVARETEMKQLDALLATVVCGAGRFVVLDGEPGVGKTRLAQEVMLSARNLGFLVAVGRCYEPQQAVAYFPFWEALHQVYAQTPPALRAQLSKRWTEVLHLIPDLDADMNVLAESRGGRGAEEQQRLFWQVVSYLEALAERQPVALLLDDLQWADSTTLALLQHLARHTHSAPIFLFAACRDVGIRWQHPLAVALRDLMRERLVERIAVRPFTSAGTGAFLRAMAGEAEVSHEFADLLYSRADGNPFFTREILLALVERGDIYRSADGNWSRRAIEEIEVPASVRAVIGERLARLSPVAQEALREASVLGQTFDFEEVRALSGRDEVTLEQALEESSSAGLVQDDGWERYAFHHALVQQALYAEIPTRRKRRLHCKAGEVIEQMAEHERMLRVAELAWHFLQAGEGLRALPYALLAGDQAEAVYAHVEAERHYRTALELAREHHDHAREAEALEKLGAVHSLQARYDTAIELFEQAYALRGGMGDIEGRWRILAQIGWALAERGTPEEGITRLRAELAAAHTLLPSATLAQLYFTLAQLWFANAHVPESAESAVKAVQLAREAGDERLELRALSLEANAVGVIGDVAEAVRLCERIVPRAEALGDYWTLVRTHHTLHRDLAHMGHVESARAHAEQWVAACERLGSPTELAFAVNEQAGDYYELGDWVRFRAGIERALGLLRHIPAASMLPMLHTDLGMLDMYQGNLEAARERFHQARALAETGRNLDYLRRVACVESEYDLLQGHPEVVRERLEPLLDRSGKETYEVTTFLLPMLAWAQLDLGDTPRADALIEEGIARAERAHMTHPLIVLWRIQGLIRTRQQRWADAARMLDKSLAASRRYLDVYSQVKALYVYGQLYVGQGQPRRANACWEQALAICQRLGERLYAVQIERALAKLGVTAAIMRQQEAP